jgi:hypothetical protein
MTDVAVMTNAAPARSIPVAVAASVAPEVDLGTLTGADYPRLYSLWKTAEQRLRTVSPGWQARADRAWQAEHRRLYPRRKKLIYADLPAECRAELEARLRGLYRHYLERCQQRVSDLARLLDALAPQADRAPQPEMTQLRESNASTYSSQTQQNKYARHALAADEEVLTRAGFTTEVVVINESRGHTAYGWDYHTQDYGLRANATEWQLDAVRRSVSLTTGEWIDLLKRRGVNPMVYDPFLPPEAVYP